MKKFVLFSCLLTLGVCLFAQGITGKGATEDVFDAEKFEAEKTKTENIVPKNQHTFDKNASVRIEYMPMYDEVRIYYDCLHATYDRGEAMDTINLCLEDFRVEHKYRSYTYLKDDKEKYSKDDRGRRMTQYISVVKFVR